MALTHTFIVVPFFSGVKGMLQPGTPRRALTRANAMTIAEGLGPLCSGVLVLCDRDDPAAGVCLEPLLICIIGDVPGDLLKELAA